MLSTLRSKDGESVLKVINNIILFSDISDSLFRTVIPEEDFLEAILAAKKAFSLKTIEIRFKYHLSEVVLHSSTSEGNNSAVFSFDEFQEFVSQIDDTTGKLCEGCLLLGR